MSSTLRSGRAANTSMAKVGHDNRYSSLVSFVGQTGNYSLNEEEKYNT